MSTLTRKAAAEFIGTFGFVFAGCGALMVSERFQGSIAPGSVPVVFGLITAAMIYSVGHISGAHFNPAVTLGFAVGRHFPKREMLGYWIAQFLGAIAAVALLSALLPKGHYYGATIPQVSLWQALAWEAVLSFFLMFVIVAVATDNRAVGMMAGCAIGATVALEAFVGGPVTGASMNPARSLAPALFEGTLANLWVYVIGPGVGAVLAVFVYDWMRCDAKPEKAANIKDAKGCC